MSFQKENSFVKLPPLSVRPYANVTVILATRRAEGIVLYHGHDQHAAVEIFRGRVRVSFDIGKSPEMYGSMYRVPTVMESHGKNCGHGK